MFMRALENLQQRHKTVHALIVGGDDVSYGRKPNDAKNWREKMQRELQLDPQRTHFLGRVPRPQYIKALQVSAAHVYLTYPFVLSWSLMEAMACGAPVVASNTAPVREIVRDGENGMLVDFFDAESLAAKLNMTLSSSAATDVMRKLARGSMASNSCAVGLRGYSSLISHSPAWAAGASTRSCTQTGTSLGKPVVSA